MAKHHILHVVQMGFASVKYLMCIFSIHDAAQIFVLDVPVEIPLISSIRMALLKANTCEFLGFFIELSVLRMFAITPCATSNLCGNVVRNVLIEGLAIILCNIFVIVSTSRPDV